MSAAEVLYPWKHITEVRDKTRKYIDDRRKGIIKSYRTPWPKLNNELLIGYEWQTINVIGGASGAAKTAIVDQIVSEGPALNTDQNVVTLKYQFEMTDLQTGARELTGPTELSLKQLFSAEGSFIVNDDIFDSIERIHKKKEGDRIYQISTPRTVDQMSKEILEFYEYAKKKYGIDVRIILVVDHALLIEGGIDDNTELDTIGNMAKMLIKMKKRVPAVIFILTQLNSYIEEPQRKENGKAANYPVKRDIYGGKQLYFAADTVMIFMRPFKDGITGYGPNNLQVSNEHIFCHILKTRFSEPTVLTFASDLAHFRISECDSPTPAKR